MCACMYTHRYIYFYIIFIYFQQAIGHHPFCNKLRISWLLSLCLSSKISHPSERPPWCPLLLLRLVRVTRIALKLFGGSHLCVSPLTFAQKAWRGTKHQHRRSLSDSQFSPLTPAGSGCRQPSTMQDESPQQPPGILPPPPQTRVMGPRHSTLPCSILRAGYNTAWENSGRCNGATTSSKTAGEG